MRIAYTCLAVALVLSLNHKLEAQQSGVKLDAKQEVTIWPKGLPAGSIKLAADKIEKLKQKEAKHPRGNLMYVESPSLTIYPASSEKATGCGIVICPGGGYNALAWQHEGVEVAKWFNSIGVTAFILKYRVPRRIPDKIHWEPMQDVQRAIRLVRHDAEKYKIDPKRIGVLGFSAGGHLTVMAGLQFETKCYEPIDSADKQSSRPDFICPIYAAYLGEKYSDNKVELGPLITVTDKAPPTFMAVTWDDRMRGAQAALLFARLKENNVAAELHAFAKGGHGYGIRTSDNAVSKWHHHLESWLKSSGFLQAK